MVNTSTNYNFKVYDIVFTNDDDTRTFYSMRAEFFEKNEVIQNNLSRFEVVSERQATKEEMEECDKYNYWGSCDIKIDKFLTSATVCDFVEYKEGMNEYGDFHHGRRIHWTELGSKENCEFSKGRIAEWLEIDLNDNEDHDYICSVIDSFLELKLEEEEETEEIECIKSCITLLEDCENQGNVIDYSCLQNGEINEESIEQLKREIKNPVFSENDGTSYCLDDCGASLKEREATPSELRLINKGYSLWYKEDLRKEERDMYDDGHRNCDDFLLMLNQKEYYNM